LRSDVDTVEIDGVVAIVVLVGDSERVIRW
jgi:hypothetical protein